MSKVLGCTPQVSLNTDRVAVADVQSLQQIVVRGRGHAGFIFRTAGLRMKYSSNASRAAPVAVQPNGPQRRKDESVRTI